MRSKSLPLTSRCDLIPPRYSSRLKNSLRHLRNNLVRRRATMVSCSRSIIRERNNRYAFVPIPHRRDMRLINDREIEIIATVPRNKTRHDALRCLPLLFQSLSFQIGGRRG